MKENEIKNMDVREIWDMLDNEAKEDIQKAINDEINKEIIESLRGRNNER